jgi:hypothetical protein
MSSHRAFLFPKVLTMLMILAGVVPMGAPTRASSTMAQCRFNPDGYFYIKGGSPRGFDELDRIQLQMTDKSGSTAGAVARPLKRTSRRPTGESHLKAKNGTPYRFATFGEFQTHSSGAGIIFEFTTETIEGVSYQFAGKFTSICVLAETGSRA